MQHCQVTSEMLCAAASLNCSFHLALGRMQKIPLLKEGAAACKEKGSSLSG